MPSEQDILDTMFDRIDILDDKSRTRTDIDDVTAEESFDPEDEHANEMTASGDFYACEFDDPEEIDDEMLM